jgi:hypothetical protein
MRGALDCDENGREKITRAQFTIMYQFEMLPCEIARGPYKKTHLSRNCAEIFT